MISSLTQRSRTGKLTALGMMAVAVVSGFVIISARASVALPSDVNNDGKVDVFDLSKVLNDWGKPGVSDVNGNGQVDIFDLSLVLSNWGKTAPTASPIATTGTTPKPSATPVPTAIATPTPVATGTTCAAGEIGAPPNCFPTPPGPLAAGKTWKMSYNEEFSGSSLNLAKLSPCFDWNSGACTSSFNNGLEHYDPAQITVSNGTAKLGINPRPSALSDSACFNGKCTYNAGMLSTSRPNAGNGSPYLFPFTYGYVEARMKYPAVSGMFTAFWMLPTDPTYSYRSEIDIVEILGGDPQTIFMTYHYNNRSQSYALNNGDKNNGACAVKDYSTDFVRFGMDWEPTYVAWYINGVKCGQFNGNSSTIESGPMQIIIDPMVNNDWERSWNQLLLSQTVSSQLEVDYLRVYQQK
jgi:beta-glucanase (GH16 family)